MRKNPAAHLAQITNFVIAKQSRLQKLERIEGSSWGHWWVAGQIRSQIRASVLCKCKQKKQTEDADGDEAGDWDRAAESERRLKLSLLSLLLWVLRDGLQF